MIKKIVLSGKETRRRILAGASRVGEIVGATLGPAGRNGILYSAYHAPTITNDGVSIARSIVLDDETEDLGAQAIVEAAMKTNARAGDGTTTSTVIASKLVADCAALIAREEGKHDAAIEGTSSRVNVVAMSREILDARDVVVAELKKRAKPVKKGDLRKIVSTSLGKAYPEHVDMVTEIVEEVGVDGYVSVEDNFGTKYGIDTEVHQGMRFLGSYASPVMIGEKILPGGQLVLNKRREAVMEDCLVLVTNHRIETTAGLKNLFSELRNTNRRKVCIIASGFEPGFTMPVVESVINSIQGAGDAIRVLAIKAPSLTTDQLTDLAAYLGAKLVNKDLKDGADLQYVSMSHCGEARRIVVGEDNTSIDGKRQTPALKERIEYLKAEIEGEKDPSFKEQAKRRLGAMQSGFAVIRVAAATEPEARYIKLKIEDAVHAAKAAVEEGIIKGGGVPLKEIADELFKGKVVHGALCEPYERIRANAGGPIAVSAGVVDPVKVTRLAVENALSVASQIVTVEVSVTQRRKSLLDELEAKLAPRDNENFRDDENQDVGYKT